jgi:hypothetical protein
VKRSIAVAIGVPGSYVVNVEAQAVGGKPRSARREIPLRINAREH